MQIVATVALYIHTASILDHLHYDAFDRFTPRGEAVPNPKTFRKDSEASLRAQGGHGWE